MVLLVVKGTKFLDEFTVECRLTDAIKGTDDEGGTTATIAATPATAVVAPTVAVAGTGGEASGAAVESPPADTAAATATGGLARPLCRLQNSRHHLRLMLLSASELSDQHRLQAATAAEKDEGAAAAYAALIAELSALLADKATPVTHAAQFEVAAERLRDFTARLYPKYCEGPGEGGSTSSNSESNNSTSIIKDKTTTSTSGGPPTTLLPRTGREVAIDALYALHESPDIDEDTRLVVYHCRALLDPHWKANESEKEDSAAVWFCGKQMSGTLAKYCGRNERSKLTVKVAAGTGPAPSGEPRMRYEDQRAVYAHMRQRKATYKQLEESELRDRVVRQSRGSVALPSGSAGCGSGNGGIITSQLRPIHPSREERIVSE